MTRPGGAKLAFALDECALHAAVLAEAAQTLPGCFDAGDVAANSIEVRRSLVQLAYRFMKLPVGLGKKVLPGLLIAKLDPLPPHATFAEKLQRLDRLGAVPCAEDRRLLHEVRNSLAHVYAENPAIQAEALTRLLTSVRSLLSIWSQLSLFAEAHLQTG